MDCACVCVRVRACMCACVRVCVTHLPCAVPCGLCDLIELYPHDCLCVEVCEDLPNLSNQGCVTGDIMGNPIHPVMPIDLW